MKTGFLGNHRLRALVEAEEAILVPEVVAVVNSHLIDLSSEWDDGTVSGGSVDVLTGGGVRLQSTATTLVDPLTDDGQDITELTHIAPFAAVMVTWTGAKASEYEIHNLVARLDPRANGGNPKTVSEFRAQLFRVAREFGENNIVLEPISKEVAIDATGEVEADFTFNFQGAGLFQPFPRVGQSPIGGTFTYPKTLVRIIALQDDGTVADNVTWKGNSGGITDTGSGWTAKLHSVEAVSDGEEEEVGGAVFFLNDHSGGAFPEFTLNRTDYTAATVTFTSSAAVPDLSGSGDLVIVAEGHTPSDSSLTWEIYDGSSTWYECFDGDVIGEDNTDQGGGDLSSIPTTGPWDVRVTLTPSTTADLNSPVASVFGVQRQTSTFLPGVGMLYGGARQVEPQTLKGNIAKATLRIAKTGEFDFRDYGSNILAENHTGALSVRFWVRDRDGTQLNRSEWLRDSTWLVEDYRSDSAYHEVDLISPLQLLRRIVPPFVVTSGNDGTRTATEVGNTLQAAYEEILDNMIGLAGQYRGPGIEDSSSAVVKRLERADGKDELDRLCFLDGSALIESQGRVRTVKMMRDGPGADTPVAWFPLGSYTPEPMGPGYSYRTDEYFVRWDWNEARGAFDAERHYLNATGITNIGGVGIYTTQQLDEETSKWIGSETLADAVGDRVPNHFGNGLIVWRIRSHYWHPELEVGDVVAIEANRFVGRSPINSQEVRGRIGALAIVTRIGDPWGTDLDLWVPGFDKIVVATGDSSQTGMRSGVPYLMHRDNTTRSRATVGTEDLETVSYPASLLGTTGRIRIKFVVTVDATGGSVTHKVNWGGTAIHTISQAGGGPFTYQVELEVIANDSATAQLMRWWYWSTVDDKITNSRSSLTLDTSAAADIDFEAAITTAGSVDLLETTVEYLGFAK